MPSQLGDVLGLGAPGLQRFSHSLVGSLATSGTKVLVQGVLDQGVEEAVAPGLVFGFADEPRSNCSFEKIQKSVLVEVEQPREHLQVEVSSDHRCH